MKDESVDVMETIQSMEVVIEILLEMLVEKDLINPEEFMDRVKEVDTKPIINYGYFGPMGEA